MMGGWLLCAKVISYMQPSIMAISLQTSQADPFLETSDDIAVVFFFFLLLLCAWWWVATNNYPSLDKVYVQSKKSICVAL